MTVLNPEANIAQTQVKIETNAAQQNVETNVSQKKLENPDQKQEINEQDVQEDVNWKAFREARKKDRADKEAAERRADEKSQEVAALKAAMEAAFSAKSSPSPSAYQQYYGMNQTYDQSEETEDQKIDRKVNELFVRREEQYKKQQQEDEQKNYPNRLMKDYPDINHVCSQENLDYLDFHYPEVSRPLQRLGDGYDKWHDTYHAIKKFIPNHSNSKQESARAENNNLKPRSISSTGPSPTGDKVKEGWQEVENRKAENWARMQRTMKGV